MLDAYSVSGLPLIGFRHGSQVLVSLVLQAGHTKLRVREGWATHASECSISGRD